MSYYFRLALARLRHTPGLIVLMVLGLAVGIGTSMTTITVRYVLGLNPVPGKSQRLLSLQDPSARSIERNNFNFVNGEVLSRLGQDYATAVISGTGITTSLSVMGQSRHLAQGVGLRYTTRSFFTVFGVAMLHGRMWTRQEFAQSTPVLVLSEPMAKYLFGESSAIGQHIRIGKTLYTVIGVSAPWNPQPRYYDLNSVAGAFGGGGDAIFLPVTAIRYAVDDLLVSRVCPGRDLQPFVPSQLLTSQCQWLNVWYLVADRHDVPLVRKLVKAHLSDILLAGRAKNMRLPNVDEILANADIVPNSVRVYVWLGIAFLVLCVINASGLQLSRVLRARKDIGIRRSLGASRIEIVKQHLCDALLITSLGGLLGIGLTYGSLCLIRNISNASFASLVQMHGAMFAFLVVLVLLCGVLVGVIPAWLASRTDPAVLVKGVE